MTGEGLHRAARLEDRAHAVLERWLRRRGWEPRVVAYPGYGLAGGPGAPGWVRILARVLLAPGDTRTLDLQLGRGWRRFLTAFVAGDSLTVEVGGRRHEVRSDRSGYVDAVVAADLAPGWTEATLTASGSTPVPAPLRVVDADATLGVVSDIDDTVIVTALPRPLVAAWNTFVRHERSRRPVRGMASLLAEVHRRHGDAPVFYLSTGAWNVAPTLSLFLRRHAFPPGPLLMTDWGPTADGWFRSGREHKRAELARLLRDFPRLQWLLVGDDGQHDPEIYAEVARRSPDRIRAVAIRQLTRSEQVRTHGTPDPLPEQGAPQVSPAVEVRAPDGFGLLARLRAAGVLPG